MLRMVKKLMLVQSFQWDPYTDVILAGKVAL